MEYLQYVPPEIVAKEAREALAGRTKTNQERWVRMIRMGLIKILDDGTVEVCRSRNWDPDNIDDPNHPFNPNNPDGYTPDGKRKKKTTDAGNAENGQGK